MTFLYRTMGPCSVAFAAVNHLLAFFATRARFSVRCLFAQIPQAAEKKPVAVGIPTRTAETALPCSAAHENTIPLKVIPLNGAIQCSLYVPTAINEDTAVPSRSITLDEVPTPKRTSETAEASPNTTVSKEPAMVPAAIARAASRGDLTVWFEKKWLRSIDDDVL